VTGPDNRNVHSGANRTPQQQKRQNKTTNQLRDKQNKAALYCQSKGWVWADAQGHMHDAMGVRIDPSPPHTTDGVASGSQDGAQQGSEVNAQQSSENGAQQGSVDEAQQGLENIPPSRNRQSGPASSTAYATPGYEGYPTARMPQRHGDQNISVASAGPSNPRRRTGSSQGGYDLK
jgi:hypothetical protein